MDFSNCIKSQCHHQTLSVTRTACVEFFTPTAAEPCKVDSIQRENGRGIRENKLPQSFRDSAHRKYGPYHRKAWMKESTCFAARRTRRAKCIRTKQTTTTSITIPSCCPRKNSAGHQFVQSRYINEMTLSVLNTFWLKITTISWLTCLTASMAYSIWWIRPCGLQTVMSLSYCVRNYMFKRAGAVPFATSGQGLGEIVSRRHHDQRQKPVTRGQKTINQITQIPQQTHCIHYIPFLMSWL